MDNRLKSLAYFSSLLITLFFSIIMIFSYLYRTSTIITYNYMLLFIISFTIIITISLIISVAAVFITFQRKQVNRGLIWLVKLGLNVFLPVITLVTRWLKGNEDVLKSLFITVNNIVVQTGAARVKPSQALVLLPHCLQDFACVHKITSDIGKCQRCGMCCIGDIVRISEESEVHVAVVTGGTAARNIVKQMKPRLIFSVACERDLLSGIMDVGKIPVIGIVNERPNGPCMNTSVDIGAFKKKLEEVLINKKKSE